MTRPDGEIYVDPDGVIKTGDLHDEHAAIYAGHLRRIQDLRARYGGSWGNDELGREFGQNFLKGMDTLERIVNGAVGMLRYTADGWREGGRGYRRADEYAREYGLLLARSSEEHPVAPSIATEGTPTGTLSSPTSGNVSTPVEPAVAHLSSTTPALSAYDARDITAMNVNGEQLPEGSRLIAFFPLPDGTVQVDANLYESVTPVAATAVTDPNGRPIDPDGRHFFVVRDNPDVDPAAPGYRPLHVAYPAGGNQPAA
ncbi:hypothetical protein AB0M35_25525 [Micromonospora sp. NPDC051196]|uniref:hypothetical protein n=1 Tax=Micromonospora sp. NPDC051196 TaxID=3155281 RepID=UPI00342228B0